MPQPKKSPTQSMDSVLKLAAEFARKSPALSPTEKTEIRHILAKKRLTMTDRARLSFLIRKTTPHVPAPVRDRARRLYRRVRPGNPEIDPPTVVPDIDPLERLAKLGGLRATLTAEQFERQLTAILAEPTIGTWGGADGVDPLDRLALTQRLLDDEIITRTELERVRDAILGTG